MSSLSYRILLREEPEGGFTVTVPALPGCITFGETTSEAMCIQTFHVKQLSSTWKV